MNRDLLHALFDGELDETAAAEARRAIERDPAWAAAWEELVRTDRALEHLAPVAVDDGFTERVLRVKRARGTGAGRLVRLLVPLAAAAVLVLAVRWSGPERPPRNGDARTLSLEPATGYAWEADTETYGTLAFDRLEDDILAELEVG